MREVNQIIRLASCAAHHCSQLPPFTSVHLAMEDGNLYLQAKARKIGKMSLVLKPVSDTEGVILGFGRIGGATVELICLDDAKMLKIVGLKFLKSGI